ncbi:hypothetical protein SDC9_79511 [bioreactor metagenome]|uniref:Uncharacterized protein n=1 Tax=bioreactor metagenome TaxID=1076179 RepID=A0A644Z4A6_9ZZZZ
MVGLKANDREAEHQRNKPARDGSAEQTEPDVSARPDDDRDAGERPDEHHSFESQVQHARFIAEQTAERRDGERSGDAEHGSEHRTAE